jgi:hypothetical protein
MIVINADIKVPFFKYEVSSHLSIKNIILDDIENMGIHNLIDNDQRISNTDWHLSVDTFRPYIEHIKPDITQVCNDLKKYFGYEEDIKLTNYWFQQYSKGDYHHFHAHGQCSFSCVYYVNLQGNNPKTTFKINSEEFEIDIKEGEILVFPGFLPHTSKENTSGEVKTVIAFNLTM